MEELRMENRQNDVWFNKDESLKYAVILMYRTSDSDVKWITKGPMKKDTANQLVEDILNTAESGRFVCLNSQFINPDCLVSVKIDLWKEKAEDPLRYGGRAYYE